MKTLLESLRKTIDQVLDPLIPHGSRVALLDFPNYSNVGDSAIWLGTRRWLQERSVHVVFASDGLSHQHERLRRVLRRGDLILLQGGGNFGDLYETPQRLRESVVAAFPDYRIIQLPQSIEFRDAERLAHARRALDGHPQLTLLVRSARDLECARNAFQADIQLCPDMAFALGALARPREAAQPLVYLRRTDAESAMTSGALLDGMPQPVDWVEEPFHPAARWAQWLAMQIRVRPRVFAGLSPLLPPVYDHAAQWRLARGCALLSRGRAVITDRLHGHILCVLLGIPHVLLNNSYGKNRAFYDTWTHESTLARWAQAPDEALRLAQQWLH